MTLRELLDVARHWLAARVRVKRKVRPVGAVSVTLAGAIAVSVVGGIGSGNDAVIDLTGVASAAAANTASVTTVAAPLLTGVSATRGIGTVAASGKANVVPLGIASPCTAQPLAIVVAGPILNLTGHGIVSGVGAMTASGKARAFPAGVAATGAAGTVTDWGWQTVPAQALTVGTPFTLALSTYDPPGTESYSIDGTGEGLPAGLSLDANTGAVTGTPTTVQTRNVRFVATKVDTGPALTTLTLTGGGAGKAWTFGHPFRQGDVPSGSYITATGPTSFQAEIRNRWPDGSVKYAVLSGVGGTSAELHATTTPPSGSNVATSALAAVTANVAMGAASAAFSSVEWGSPFRTITTGPVMSSWAYRKAIGADAHLVAWLEVRAYSNGQVEVLPWIENGYLNVASPNLKTGRAVFTLNGVTKYDSINDANTPGGYEIPLTVDGSGVLTMPHHTRAVLIRAGTFSHWTSGAGLTPVHDRAYLTATKFVPAYYATSIDEASLAALTTSYNPGRLAYTTGGMGGTGYAPDIGLLPNAAALYLCSGDARAYRAAISCGFSLSNYCIHYRDETTNRPLRFSQHPNTSINSGVLPPTPGGGAANRYASSHHPAAAYLPYLLTGWDWFVEEMLFQVTDHYLARSTGGRKSPNYYFYMSAGGPAHNENSGIRAVAWQWRTTGMAAALTPDGDVMQTELKTVLNYNATKFRTEYETGDSDCPYGPNVFGALVRQHEISTSGFGLWHVAFWNASLGLLSDIEPISDATARTNFEWLVSFGAQLWGHMLGPTGDVTKYGFVRAANYADVFLGEPTGSSYTWFTTMGEAWTRSWGSPNSVVSNTLVGGNIDSGGDGLSTSYWGNLQPAIAYSVERGSAGALEGYNRMIGSTNWASKVPQFNAIPVWGIKPR